MVLVALNFLLMLGFGFAFGRYALRIQAAPLLLATTLGGGSLGQVLLLNLFLHLTISATAAWLTAFCLALGGGLAWLYGRRRPPAPLVLGMSRRTAGALALAGLALVAYVYYAMTRLDNGDEPDHSPRTALLANDALGLSPTFPFYGNPDPALCDWYHFAENATNAAWFRQTGVQQFNSLRNLRVAYHTASALSLSYALLWLCLGQRRPVLAALGAFALLTSAPAAWLGVLGGLAPDAPLFAYVRLLAENSAGLPLWERLLSLSVGGVAYPYVSYMYTPNPTAGWTPVLSTLILAALWHERPRPLPAYVALGVLSASTAIFFLTLTPLALLPTGFILTLRLLGPRQGRVHALAGLLIFGISALLTLSLQGGYITATLFCAQEPLRHAADVAGDTTVALSAKPAWSYGEEGGVVRLFAPQNALRVLLDWGLSLFVLPVLFIYALWRRQWLIFGLSLTSLALVALFFNFRGSASAERDSLRIALLPLWLTGSLSVLLIGAALDSPRPLVRRLGAGGGALMWLVLVLGGTVQALGYVGAPPARPSLFMRPLDYQVQAQAFGRLSDGALIWDAQIIKDYGRHFHGPPRASTVFGLQTTYAFNEQAEALADAWDSLPLPAFLYEQGYRYVYVDEIWQGGQDCTGAALLAHPANYRLVGRWQAGDETRHLYEILSANRDPFLPLPTSTPANLGLSAAAQALYAEAAPPVTGRIFSPKTGTPAQNAPLRLGEIISTQSTATQNDLLPLLKALSVAENPATLGDSAALSAWQASKEARHLAELGFDYLLIDRQWRSWLSAEENAALDDPAQYRLVAGWRVPCTANLLDHELYAILPAP